MSGVLPRISVIVPAYQAEATIDRCLKALACQTVDREIYEILLVDDGSTDRTRSLAEGHRGIHVLSQSHAGPAVARNLGIQQARGEIILFTDADCEPVADWIEQMSAPFQDEEIVGAKGAYLTRQLELVARFVQVEYEEKYDWMAREQYIDFIDTYAAGYRRNILLEYSGFDPVFPSASVEDQEFSFRLARQGYKMVFVSKARVYHWGHAQNLGIYLKRKFRIGYWKSLIARRYPDKLARDTHTPDTLKLQVFFVGLGLVFLPVSPLSPIFLWGSLASGLAFLISTLPFVVRAWRQDRPVALVAPGLLFGRALALGAGFAVGVMGNLRSDPGVGGLESA